MSLTIKEFAQWWTHESGITSRVLGALTDASLGQRITAKDRSLGEIAWHLATSIPEMASHTGLAIAGGDHEAPPPASAAAIKAAYDQAARSLLEQVTSTWTDATLEVEDDMYGERWKRGMTLTVLILHEIHHRGAMSVLIRQAGLVLPDIYGPTREQTEAMKG
jgi:uncharacterized damage-inducible protein DinB